MQTTSISDLLRRLMERSETVGFLTSRDLRSRHRDKMLGNLWSLLEPIAFVSVYFLVFGLLFGQTDRGRSTDFLSYLVIGVLAWRFHDSALTQSAGCLRGSRGLIHGASFPRAIFPIAVCLARLYDFGWGLLVFAVVLLMMGVSPSGHLLWAPLLIALQLVFVIGCCLIAADWGAFYADTTDIVRILTRLWFFLSPVMYYATGDRGLIPEPYLWIYMLNPIACLLESYRAALVFGRMPDPHLVLYVVGVSAGLLLAGLALFARHDGEFAKYV